MLFAFCLRVQMNIPQLFVHRVLKMNVISSKCKWEVREKKNKTEISYTIMDADSLKFKLAMLMRSRISVNVFFFICLFRSFVCCFFFQLCVWVFWKSIVILLWCIFRKKYIFPQQVFTFFSDVFFSFSFLFSSSISITND